MRFSNLILKRVCKNSVLLYNITTFEKIKISRSEYSVLESRSDDYFFNTELERYLINQGFLIEDEFEEKKYVNFLLDSCYFSGKRIDLYFSEQDAIYSSVYELCRGLCKRYHLVLHISQDTKDIFLLAASFPEISILTNTSLILKGKRYKISNDTDCRSGEIYRKYLDLFFEDFFMFKLDVYDLISNTEDLIGYIQSTYNNFLNEIKIDFVSNQGLLDCKVSSFFESIGDR